MASHPRRSARYVSTSKRLRSLKKRKQRVRVALDIADLWAIVFARDPDLIQEVEYEIEEILENSLGNPPPKKERHLDALLGNES